MFRYLRKFYHHGTTRRLFGITISAVVILLLLFKMAGAAEIQATFIIFSPFQLTDDGQVNYYELSTTPMTVFPQIAHAGAVSDYEIEFPAAERIPIGGSIRIIFPEGFLFSASCNTQSDHTENNDINGVSAGVVKMYSLHCASSSHTITLTLTGSPILKDDRVHFFVSGVINTPIPTGEGSAGYSAVIETRNTSGAVLEVITSLPFFLTPSGTQVISGTLFNDNGAGLFGFARDGVRNGLEPGLQNIEVCLNSENGSQCLTTDEGGEYLFSRLRDGWYSISVPPLSSDNIIGGPFYSDVELTGGSNRNELDFAFEPAERMITVTVANIPEHTDVRVFAAGGPDGSGYAVRDVVWNAQSSRSVTLPVSDGAWSIGIEYGGVQAPTFIVPDQQEIAVSGDNPYQAIFYLQPALLRVKGRVIDTSGNGIPNVFVFAIPRNNTNRSSKESVTQSLIGGLFELPLSSGQYRLEASMPGMPPIPGIEINIREDSGNSVIDNNGSADVYREGKLVTGDLTFIIPKGERSISGRILDESGGPIAFAVVSAREIDEQGRPIGALVEKSTDVTGLFTLFVTDGTFKVHASSPAAGEISDKIVTVAGKNVSGQDMRTSIANYGTVRGIITKGGKGTAGAFVTITGPAGTGSSTTDMDGNYAIRVKAGSGYSIEATVRGAGSVESIENVIVPAGGIVGQKNFILNTPGTIIVTIPGVTDAYVDASDSALNGDGTSLNPTPGQYRISVLPGIYTVTAQTPQYGIIGEKEQVVVLSGGIAALSFALPTSFIANGRIVSDSSACKDGAVVSIVDTTQGRMVEATTDETGAYTVTLPMGIYALTASKSGCVDRDAPPFFAVRNGNISIDDRRLTPAATSISGAVQLGGRNISFETKVVAESSAGTIRSTSIDITVQAGNNYTLSVTPGTWTVFARADGYESARHTILVGDNGKTQNISLAIIPGYVQKERVATSVSPAKGGVVKNMNVGTAFTLVLPAGALGNSSESGSVSTKITTAVVAETAVAVVVGGAGIEIAPKDSAGRPIKALFSAGTDAKITVPYSKSEVAALGINESKLMLAVWSEDKQQWTPFPTTIDTVNATLSGVPPHFSVFAPIVPKAPPTPPELLVQPTAPQVPQVGVPVSGGGAYIVPPVIPIIPNNAPIQNQLEDTHIISQPATIESVITHSESTQQPALQRFPVPRKAVVKKPSKQESQEKHKIAKIVKSTPKSITPSKSVKSAMPIESAKSAESIELFEASIAIDDTSRVMRGAGELSIHGEIIKSISEPESLPVRFMISRRDGSILLEQNEEFVVAAKSSFSKQFQLREDIPDGHYTLTLVASYRGEILSSSDRFLVQRTIKKPFEYVKLSSDTPPSNQTILLFLSLLSVFVIMCAIWMWYTINKLSGSR